MLRSRLLLAGVWIAGASVVGERPALEIMALANEGVLLRAGDDTVVIDGVVTEPYSIYGALPPSAWSGLLAGEEPFEDLDLVLVSHPHGDHFQAGPMIELLSRRTTVRLLSSPPVVAAVQGSGELAPPARRSLARHSRARAARACAARVAQGERCT